MGGIQRSAVRTVVTVVLGLAVVTALVAEQSAAKEPVAPVDLAIDASLYPNPVPPGSAVEYRAHVRNQGSALADDVLLLLEIPAGGIDPGAAVDELGCTVAGSTRVGADHRHEEEPWTVECSLGTLAQGADIRLAVPVIAGGPGTVVSTAFVASNSPEARPRDNLDEIALYVLPDAPATMHAFRRNGPLNVERGVRG